ncbi:hypothetical protein, partial [Lentzea roselyniae]|uniref:hypothetical protein n=1 Tax=Lentzea roselyniae TaxID=531940 RepID=UPI0031F991BE
MVAATPMYRCMHTWLGPPAGTTAAPEPSSSERSRRRIGYAIVQEAEQLPFCPRQRFLTPVPAQTAPTCDHVPVLAVEVYRRQQSRLFLGQRAAEHRVRENQIWMPIDLPSDPDRVVDSGVLPAKPALP